MWRDHPPITHAGSISKLYYPSSLLVFGIQSVGLDAFMWITRICVYLPVSNTVWAPVIV